MKFASPLKNLSEIPISRKIGKIFAWFVMGIGLFCLILGIIVKDDAPALAQTAPPADAQTAPADAQAAPALAQHVPTDAQAAQAAQAAEPLPVPELAQTAPPADAQTAPPADAALPAPSDALPDAPQAAQNGGQSPQKTAPDITRKGKTTQAIVDYKREHDESSLFSRIMSIVGIFGFIGIAWLMSSDRKKILWKLVAVGTVIQLIFALFILRTSVGNAIFSFLNDAITVLLDFTSAGTAFLFASFATGQVEPGLLNTAMSILPPIIFFSSFMTVLYHLGIMQWIVKGMAVFMMKFMGVSGAESLSAVANIFVGMTEAPLVVKPYVEKMTKSELFAVMTGGMATVAGGVMASYVAMLQPYFPDIAGHLIAASVMSAPASLVIAKMMIPETETPETMGKVDLHDEKPDANVIDVAARGAGEGLQLAMNVGAMLLAFVALIALINFILGLPSRIVNDNTYEHVKSYVVQEGGTVDGACEDNFSKADMIACTHSALLELARLRHIEIDPGLAALESGQLEKIDQTDRLYRLVIDKSGAVAQPGGDQASPGLEKKSIWPLLSLETILGWIFFPIAFLMGVPLHDCFLVGQLLGEKMAINEFVAYLHLSQTVEQLSYRSIVISTYALCGFANFGSIAIQIGGIGGMAPSRRSEIAKLGIKSMIAGSIAAFMTATIAGAII